MNIPTRLFVFLPHVYLPPYAPYYDEYEGHVFVYKQHDPEDAMWQHIVLECWSDPSIKLKGTVHPQDIMPFDELDINEQCITIKRLMRGAVTPGEPAKYIRGDLLQSREFVDWAAANGTRIAENLP